MGKFEYYVSGNKIKIIKKLAKGWTSEIFLAKYKKKNVVLKVLREKSNRRDMVEREAQNLKIANSAGVGPKLIDFDKDADVVVMEFIDGPSFDKWLLQNPSRDLLENFIDELYSQAKVLDKIGLDHGQLAGRGRNILVRKNLPVIIDFEKASAKRKVHNVKVLESFLFRSRDSGIVKKIREILSG